MAVQGQQMETRRFSSPITPLRPWFPAPRSGTVSAHVVSPGPFTVPNAESWTVEHGSDQADRMCVLSNPLLVCVRVGVLAAVVLALLLRHLYFTDSGGDGDRGLCLTAGCAAMDAMLAASVNLSWDPCTDFTAHVCSGQWRYNDSGDNPLTALAVLQNAWARRAREALEAQLSSSRTIRKAANMFRSCLERKDFDLQSANMAADTLRGFLNEHGVYWPAEPRPDVEPLDLFLDYAITLDLPLWLRVRLMRFKEHSPREVLMNPVARPPPFFEIQDTDTFSEDWLSCFNFLAPVTGVNFSSPDEQTQRDRADRVLRMQRTITRTIFGTGLGRYAINFRGAYQTFMFADVKNKTSKFTGARLEDMLNNHFQMIFPLRETDLVLTSDVAYLDRSLDVFSMFSKRDMADALGWWLVQSSGIYVQHKAPVHYTPTLFCAIHVIDVYKLLVAADQANTLFAHSSWRTLPEFVSVTLRESLNFWRSDADTSSNSTTTLSKWNRAALDLPGGDVSVKIWPDTEYMSESRLEDIYWNFPDGYDDSYVTHWVHAKRNASRLVAKNVYHELSRLPHFYYDVPIAYDIQHNTMTISATALMQPLHFIDGTEGMLHAGLGSMLAANALRLLMWSGVKPGDSRSSAREFQLSDAVVSEREALKILHAAYTEAVEGTGQTLASFRNFSANQLFFLVWCYTNCFLTDFQSHDNFCDDVVAGYEPFHAAFRCGHN